MYVLRLHVHEGNYLVWINASALKHYLPQISVFLCPDIQYRSVRWKSQNSLSISTTTSASSTTEFSGGSVLAFICKLVGSIVNV